MAHLTPHAHGLFARQHGTASVEQLLATGLSLREIRHLQRAGGLELVLRGAYRTPSAPITEESRSAAVCLARPDVAIAGPTAGRLWGLRRLPFDRRIHVIAPRASQPAAVRWVVPYRTDARHDRDVDRPRRWHQDHLESTHSVRPRPLAPARRSPLGDRAGGPRRPARRRRPAGGCGRLALAPATVGSTLPPRARSPTAGRPGGVASRGASGQRTAHRRGSRPRAPAPASNYPATAAPVSTSPCQSCAGRSKSTCIPPTASRSGSRRTGAGTTPPLRLVGRPHASTMTATRTASTRRSPISLRSTPAVRSAPQADERTDRIRPRRSSLARCSTPPMSERTGYGHFAHRSPRATGAQRMSRRKRPVWLASSEAMCSGVPSPTIVPPPLPPFGPRSITQSAVLITSRLCSITNTVLP